MVNFMFTTRTANHRTINNNSIKSKRLNSQAEYLTTNLKHSYYRVPTLVLTQKKSRKTGIYLQYAECSPLQTRIRNEKCMPFKDICQDFPGGMGTLLLAVTDWHIFKQMNTANAKYNTTDKFAALRYTINE